MCVNFLFNPRLHFVELANGDLGLEYGIELIGKAIDKSIFELLVFYELPQQ
jgi:hypothetical protein